MRTSSLPPETEIRVLLIEDNPAEARLIEERLREVPYTSFVLCMKSTLHAGLEVASDSDVILLDLSLPDSQGYETFASVHAAVPDTPLILLTGFEDDRLALTAVRHGAQDYLIKDEVTGAMLARAIRYAIERQGAEKTLQQRNKNLVLLNRIATATSSSLELQETLDTALEAVLNLDLLQEDATGIIFLYGNAQEAASLAVYPPQLQHLACQSELAALKPGVPCHRALQTGEMIITSSHVEPAPPWEGQCLCLPLKTHGHLLGVMGLRRGRPAPLSPPDVDLLRAVSSQIAIGIENAQLYEQTRRWAGALATLNRTGQLLTSTLDRDEVLRRVIDETRAMLHAEAASVLLLDPIAEELVFAAVAGTGAGALHGRRMPADAGIAGWVLCEWQPVLTNDVQEDPRFFKRIDKISGLTTQSLLAVPLICKGEVIGVIEALNHHDRIFSEHDLKLLTVLADAAAIALENARLYEAEREQRRLVEHSRTQLVQSEKLAATGRLAASLAHEINNPLQAIHNSLQLILSFPVSPEEQKMYLEMADEEVERLIHMVSRILDFARRSKGEQQLVDINAVVNKVLILSEKYLEHRHVILERKLQGDLHPVMANPNELGQVFLNLILNAMEAMEGGGRLRVSSGYGSDGKVHVSISDSGKGIQPQHMDYLFEPFFTTKAQGTGLGLSISYNLVERHGGTIEVESRPDEGTTFTVCLPSHAGASPGGDSL